MLFLMKCQIGFSIELDMNYETIPQLEL